MLNTPPSLQQFCLRRIVDYEEINDVLNPPLDWDNDVRHLYNHRLTRDERDEFEMLVVNGTRTLAQVKADIRALLVLRPFDLDLAQLKLAIPWFSDIPECVARQIWVEANIFEFERYVPGQLWYVVDWNIVTMTWDILRSILDGCTDSWLFESLNELEQRLIEQDKDELWRIDIGSVWLGDFGSLNE